MYRPCSEKYMSDEFPIQNEGDVYSQFISNFALDYSIQRVQDNQNDLKLKW
jgi:hypothetical protein